MIRILWTVAAWWPGRLDAVRRAWLRPSPTLERLLGHGRAAWRRRWLGMAVAWLLCLPGWAGSLLMPDHYRSSALLFADPGAGAALASHANGRTRATLAALQSALASPAARALLAAAAPLPAGAAPAPERSWLRPPITVAIEAPALFRVSYRALQPDVARRALQSLVELVTTNPPPVGPRSPDGAAAELQAGRDRAAGLRDELAAALMQRDARARQLAVVPPVLAAGRSNPIHEQVALQLGRQETLIAGLRSRLAEAEAEIAGLEPRPEADAEPIPGAPRSGLADRRAAGPLDGPAFRLVDPPDWPGAPEGVARPLLLAAVLAAGLVAGAAAAAWSGQLDGTVDGGLQLERRFRLPVLGTIAVPASPGQRRLRRRAEAAFGLAGLGLLGLFGGLLAAEALDLLAPLGLLRGPAAG